MFLTDDDYKAQVKENILSAILQDDLVTRQTAEVMAQAEMEGYLAARYDVAQIFAASGSARHQVIIMYMIDMTLYHLYARMSPDQVPTLRKERYDTAINWLKMVAKQHINPALPEPQDQTKEEIRYGSNEARRNHF